MDPYTQQTKDWLDQRFRQTDASGVYVAHQPIYGFRKGHSEPWLIIRYVITYQIMRALAHLRFSSLLDVGGAEGYKAALARELFGADVTSCDLSEEACTRAREIYGIEGQSIDIHELPFEDGQFDVVVCSETLEHVSRLEDATRELLRVARRAVVITVPHEPEEWVERNIREKVPHGHIHALRPGSFDFAIPPARRIIVRRMLSPLLRAPFVVADAMPKEEGGRLPPPLVRGYNAAVPALRKAFGVGAAASLVRLDDSLANRVPAFRGLLFVLLKDEGAYSEPPSRVVTPQQIIEFAVPFHYPGASSAGSGSRGTS